MTVEVEKLVVSLEARIGAYNRQLAEAQAVTANIVTIRDRTARLLADCARLQPSDDASLLGLSAVRWAFDSLIADTEMLLMDCATLEDRERGWAAAMRRMDEISALMDRTAWLVTPSPSAHLN